MQDRGVWSVPLYPYAPVVVRLHAFFLFFALVALYVGAQVDAAAEAVAMLLCLFLSVVLHEAGHCVAAFRMGGVVREIVIGPLGGLSGIGVQRDPSRDAVAAFAGPLVNLGLVVLGSLALVFVRQFHWGLYIPFAPVGAFSVQTPIDTLKMFVWVNWMLFLVNLLPVAPMDGGRLLLDYLSTKLSQSAALQHLGATGMCLGVLILFLTAVWSWGAGPNPTSVPVWLPLSLLAFFVYFSGQQALRISQANEGWAELLGPPSPTVAEDSPDWKLLEDGELRQDDPPALMAWLKTRSDSHQEEQQGADQDDDRLADEILGRLSVVGMDGLTTEERQVLERVSKRLRAKQKRS